MSDRVQNFIAHFNKVNQDEQKSLLEGIRDGLKDKGAGWYEDIQLEEIRVWAQRIVHKNPLLKDIAQEMVDAVLAYQEYVYKAEGTISEVNTHSVTDFIQTILDVYEDIDEVSMRKKLNEICVTFLQKRNILSKEEIESACSLLTEKREHTYVENIKHDIDFTLDILRSK